jgi:hypothetical protein
LKRLYTILLVNLLFIFPYCIDKLLNNEKHDVMMREVCWHNTSLINCQPHVNFTWYYYYCEEMTHVNIPYYSAHDVYHKNPTRDPFVIESPTSSKRKKDVFKLVKYRYYCIRWLSLRADVMKIPWKFAKYIASYVRTLIVTPHSVHSKIAPIKRGGGGEKYIYYYFLASCVARFQKVRRGENDFVLHN